MGEVEGFGKEERRRGRAIEEEREGVGAGSAPVRWHFFPCRTGEHEMPKPRAQTHLMSDPGGMSRYSTGSPDGEDSKSCLIDGSRQPKTAHV